MSFASLLEAFEALNQRKRNDPKSLTSQENQRWKKLRREIEMVLFDHSVDPNRDTREYLRVPVSLSARYWSRNELKDRYIQVLGDGGLMVATVDPLPVGTQLDLEIVLADLDLDIPVRGEVVWSKEAPAPDAGMGIKFLSLSYEQKRLIYELVDDNLRQHLLERREYARVEARFDVRFVYADGYFELQTEDISLGGMFINTEQLLPIGEIIQIVISLGDEKSSIKVKAQVVHVVNDPQEGLQSGLGVRFVDLDPSDRSAIKQFLQDKTSQSGPENRIEFLRVDYKSNLNAGICHCQSLSSSGVVLQLHLDLPEEESLLELTLRHRVSGQILCLPGKVVRSSPATGVAQSGEVEVVFGDLTSEQRALLQTFIQLYQVD